MEDIEADIAAKKKRLDALRPRLSKSLAALQAWYDVELTYTSNAIEGNTLTRVETAVVLEQGITVSGKPLKDHLEALGHRDALGYIRLLAQASEPIRERNIREIHRLVLARADPEEAGRYSRHQRAIAGSALALPSPAEIPARMGDLAAWLAAAPADHATAFEAHYRLVTIHPFSDGNGRAARLLMNLLLLRAGYPPVVIGPDERIAYLDALQARQLRDDPKPWATFMTARLDASLTHHLQLLEKAAAGGGE
jgi:cell filamentation protein, protein adenylyltransferase